MAKVFNMNNPFNNMPGPFKNKTLEKQILHELGELAMDVSGYWMLVKLSMLYPHTPILSVDEEVINEVGNALIEELLESIYQQFGDESIPADILIKHMKSWVPSFMLNGYLSEQTLH